MVQAKHEMLGLHKLLPEVLKLVSLMIPCLPIAYLLEVVCCDHFWTLQEMPWYFLDGFYPLIVALERYRNREPESRPVSARHVRTFVVF